MSVVDYDFHAFAQPPSLWVPKHSKPTLPLSSRTSSAATIFEAPGNRPFGPFSYSLWGPKGPSVSVDILTDGMENHLVIPHIQVIQAEKALVRAMAEKAKIQLDLLEDGIDWCGREDRDILRDVLKMEKSPVMDEIWRANNLAWEGSSASCNNSSSEPELQGSVFPGRGSGCKSRHGNKIRRIPLSRKVPLKGIKVKS
ncbi:hypothetical protein DXG01_013967 [Tephrocybe rancida]|nr:hypothetical protein DXG01_013967 [Tephrocybe rancida]